MIESSAPHARRVTLWPLALTCLLAPAPRAQPPAAADQPPPLAGLLVVLNKSDGDVSLVDPNTGATRARIEVGVGPHEAATSPDASTVVVCNYGDQTPGNSLSVLDVATGKVQKTIALGHYARPHGIQFFADGKRVAVTAETEKALLVVDLEKGEVVAAHATGQAVSHMVALSPDGKRAYVANIGSGSMTALDLEAGKHLGNVTTNRGAEGIAVHPTRNEIWVTNRAAHTVSVVDGAELTVSKEMKATTFPIRVAFTTDGKHALVSCAQSGELAVFDVETREEVRRISMRLPVAEATAKDGAPARAGQSPMPVGILVEPSGRNAFVANTFSNLVSVVDLAAWKVVRQITAGTQPDGMTWVPGPLTAR